MALTTDDAIFTFNLVRDKSFPGDPALAAPWADVRIEALSPDTLRFTLPSSNASFLQYTTLGLLPRHLWSGVRAADLTASSLNTAPIGSGPWRYVDPHGEGGPRTAVATAITVATATPMTSDDTSSMSGVLLERNPYSLAPMPHLARLWFRLYPTFGAALDALRLGEVHGLGHIPDDRLADVQAIPGVTMHTQTLARYTMLILNNRSPFFSSSETRHALDRAIDRQAIIDANLGGQGKPQLGPVLPQSWAYSPPASDHSYNPDMARRLLDAAGWVLGPTGIRSRAGVTMTVVLAANADIPVAVAVTQQVAGYLRAVGIDARPALVSRESLANDYLKPLSFHIALATWQAPGADPDVFAYWHTFSGGSGASNFAGWSNPEADRALETARLSSDRSIRAQSYTLFQTAFERDMPSLMLYAPLNSYATRPPASGITLPPKDLLSQADRFDSVEGWFLQLPKVP